MGAAGLFGWKRSDFKVRGRKKLSCVSGERFMSSSLAWGEGTELMVGLSLQKQRAEQFVHPCLVMKQEKNAPAEHSQK